MNVVKNESKVTNSQLINSPIKENERYAIVKSLNLMMFLIRNGNDLMRVRDDLKNKQYKVFLFENNEKVKNDIYKYFNENKTKNQN